MNAPLLHPDFTTFLAKNKRRGIPHCHAAEHRKTREKNFGLFERSVSKIPTALRSTGHPDEGGTSDRAGFLLLLCLARQKKVENKRDRLDYYIINHTKRTLNCE